MQLIFVMLILYLATLLNTFISFGLFCVGSLVFSTEIIMSSAKKSIFIISFSIFMLFVYSSCLIVVTRTLSTAEEEGESRSPFLPPDLSPLVSVDFFFFFW